MVIDTSALISVLFDEPDRYPDLRREALDRLVSRWEIRIMPVSVDQVEAARQAYRQYGRGQHKAALNFGDCFSYALAKISGESLLCKGNDFALTDIAVISPPPSPQNT